MRGQQKTTENLIYFFILEPSTVPIESLIQSLGNHHGLFMFLQTLNAGCKVFPPQLCNGFFGKMASILPILHCPSCSAHFTLQSCTAFLAQPIFHGDFAQLALVDVSEGFIQRDLCSKKTLCGFMGARAKVW